MKQIKLAIIIILISAAAFSQNVGVNADGSTPDASAMLDVKSTYKGMLIPRVALTGTTDITTISSPATSLLVYNTATSGDITPGFYYWNGTSWTPIGGSSPTTYSVGDFAQGGIVFWVDETGEHGLICAKEDQITTGERWNAGISGSTQAKGDGPYAGQANTSIIIAAQVSIGDDGSTYAARVCNELKITEGGKTYGDWYLPSKEELNLMYQNKATINTTAVANGGSSFDSEYYWSSTEYNFNSAWGHDFDRNDQSNATKSTLYKVRAIRAF